MHRTFTGLSAFVAIIIFTPHVTRGDILAVSYSNPSPSHGMTFKIDENTGTGVNVGLSNINFLNSLARDQNGVYWSAGMPNSDLNNHLITIDPATGAGSVGPLLNFSNAYMGALAFSPTNVLYGIALNDYLYTINTQTGEGTLIGHIGTPGLTIGLNAMAFAPDGSLYGWGVQRNGLIKINPATAAYTDVSSTNGGGGFIQSMTFGPDGTLYGARDFLYRIDTVTGVATQIGSGGGFADVRGIAFLSVPEPSTLALLGMGAAVLIALAWNRQKA